jgi:hypothetical protein
MTTTEQEQEREEQRLANDLKHTLKLVPQSQRELFVFELAKYMLKRDAQREAQVRIDEQSRTTADTNGNVWFRDSKVGEITQLERMTQLTALTLEKSNE